MTRLPVQAVIACDKRQVFAHGSEAMKQSSVPCGAMDCFAGARNDDEFGLPAWH